MTMQKIPTPRTATGWLPDSAPADPAGIGPGAARRCLDVTASAVALAILGLPLLALMLLVRLTSPGPALFRQRDADVVGEGADPDTGRYLHEVVPARTAIEARYLVQPTLRATVGVLADTVRHLLGRPLPAYPEAGRPQTARFGDVIR